MIAGDIDFFHGMHVLKPRTLCGAVRRGDKMEDDVCS
jgi:hypothetical protein